MIDHLEKMRARKAAKDYMEGLTIRQQADELSVKKLAGKFECSRYSIERALDNAPAPGLDDDDGRIIRQCYAEHERLSRRGESLTLKALACHYQIPVESIRVELDLAGFEPTPRNLADRVPA